MSRAEHFALMGLPFRKLRRHCIDWDIVFSKTSSICLCCRTECRARWLPYFSCWVTAWSHGTVLCSHRQSSRSPLFLLLENNNTKLVPAKSLCQSRWTCFFSPPVAFFCHIILTCRKKMHFKSMPSVEEKVCRLVFFLRWCALELVQRWEEPFASAPVMLLSG